VIRAAKDWLKRRWPPLRLRTILFATLFFVAALPGVGAVFLRVYENTLVRQTEAELVAQGSALAASAQALWPGAPPPAMPDPTKFQAEPPQIDLSATPILPARPDPVPVVAPLSPDAQAAGQQLAPILARTRQSTLAAIELLGPDGRVLANGDVGKSYADLPEVRAALAGQPQTVLRRNAGYRAVYWFEWLSRAAAIRVHHARPIVIGGRVVGVLLLSRSARALFRGLYEDRGKIALGVVLIFGTLVVLSGLLSRGIARPIVALSQAAREVAEGRGSHVPEVPATAAIEIQSLYRDFAAMAEAIELRSRYLRDFAHAVSHEFKTPLAGIRGAIELLQDHDAEMAPADRRRFLANADADAARLATLVTRLLELARADMTRAPVETGLDLAPVLARVADALGDAVRVEVPDGLPPVAMGEAMLETILVSLVENSRHAGATEVVLGAASAGDAVLLTVADNGAGIAEPDRARIFEPFFTTRRAEGGSGLGLAIVASLLEASRGSIRLARSNGGTCFELMLPLFREG